MSQYLRPASDISRSYVDSPAWSKVDEETPNDGDYISTNTNDVNANALMSLSHPAESPGGGDVIIRFRGFAKDSECHLYAELLQGSTVIATTQVVSNIGSSTYVTYSYTLTSAEKGSITDYTDLCLKLQLRSNSTFNYTRCSWVEVEVPDADEVSLGLEMGCVS